MAVAATIELLPRALFSLRALGFACAMLGVSTPAASSATCKPNHFRPPYVIKTMGPCVFDPASLSFAGAPAEQARCLMRGMDHSRNLGPAMERLPFTLAARVGSETGLPDRETLSALLSREGLEWDFAARLWTPLSRANDNDPNAPMARYFVIHDTSGPNYGHRPFPDDIDISGKINNLAHFRCADGWGKAHVVVNRSGGMLLNHDLSIPWRETKFEQAANFSGALKGLFIHVEMIQPRRGGSNDGQSPNPGFTTAQYDRLALIYTVASVRAERWLIPTFHAALDAEIRNGHDDPLNFDAERFADSLQRLLDRLDNGARIAAASPVAEPTPVPWGEIDGTLHAAVGPDSHLTSLADPGQVSDVPAPGAGANSGPPADRLATAAQLAGTGPKAETKAESESSIERKTAGAGHCQTRFVKGHRRRLCRTDVAESRGRGISAHAIRSVDRGVWPKSDRPWHHARYVRARHERSYTRHGRA